MKLLGLQNALDLKCWVFFWSGFSWAVSAQWCPGVAVPTQHCNIAAGLWLWLWLWLRLSRLRTVKTWRALPPLPPLSNLLMLSWPVRPGRPMAGRHRTQTLLWWVTVNISPDLSIIFFNDSYQCFMSIWENKYLWEFLWQSNPYMFKDRFFGTWFKFIIF